MRVRHEHWSAFLELAECNPEIITNKFIGVNARNRSVSLWERVKVSLNSLGFGEKTVEEWKKVANKYCKCNFHIY